MDRHDLATVGDSAKTNMETVTTVNIWVNDYDPINDTLTISVVQSPTNQGGTTSINDNAPPHAPSDDSIDYALPPIFSGTDTFSYTIDNDNDRTDTATAPFTVKNAATVCNPIGNPNYDQAAENETFLWKEGTICHLRAVAEFIGWQKYTDIIQLIAPDNLHEFRVLLKGKSSTIDVSPSFTIILFTQCYTTLSTTSDCRNGTTFFTLHATPINTKYLSI